MLKIKSKLIFLGVIFILTGCSKQAEAPQELLTVASSNPIEANYKTTKVITGDFVKEASYSASIYYPLTKELTFQTKGSKIIFDRYLVSEKEKVTKGMAIANFIVDYDAVEFAEKELQIKRAKETYKNRLNADQKAISEAEDQCITMTAGYEKDIFKLKIEKQRIQYDQYKYSEAENIKQMEADLDDYKSSLSVTQLYAPMDGVISQIDTTKQDGDIVKPGEVLVTMYSDETIQLQVADEGNSLQYNMEVTIEAGYKGDTYSLRGRVISCPNHLPNEAGDNLVKIEILDPLKGINLPDSNNIKVKVDNVRMENVLLVDFDAVYLDEKPPYIKILDQGAVHKRSITVGDVNSEYYWILQGLEEGQTLIMK